MLTEIIKTRKEIRKRPKNFDPKDENIFSHEFSIQLPAVKLFTIKKAVILKDVVYKFPHFYDQLCLNKKLSILSRVKRISLLFKKGKKIHSGIWIIDDWSTGYFHWLSDALPRLWISRNYMSDHIVLLPSQYRQLGFVTESLNILKIPFQFFDSHKKVVIDQMLIPQHAAKTGHFNSDVICQLRDAFRKQHLFAGRFRKLYISRKKAKARRVVNEAEFESLLKQFGFEVIIPEDIPFSNQISLLNEAKIIIGVHGAGLTNMLFMSPGSKIVELRREGDDHNNCYFSLASALDHNYYYVNCKTTGSYTQEVDFIVDLGKIKDLFTIV